MHIAAIDRFYGAYPKRRERVKGKPGWLLFGALMTMVAINWTVRVECALEPLESGFLEQLEPSREVRAFQDQIAEWLSQSVRRSDWNEELRRGEVSTAELALANVLALQAVLRDYDGRLRDGSLRSTGLEP